MLISLRVKNLALIEEAEVDFQPGLNILTGETGAGKSILIGSVNLALGAKGDKDLIRKGADYALVELTFHSEEKGLLRKLSELDLPAQEDGTVVISRRIQPARSVSRINGETVTAKQIKELSELLIDIHGQHEHQSLLHKKKHLEILDAYAGEELEKELAEVRKLYAGCRKLKEQIENENLDEAARKREMELAEFEWKEIEAARIQEAEDEQLENDYRRMTNGKKIGDALTLCYRYSGYEEPDGAGSQTGRALRELKGAAAYDGRVEELSGQLMEIDGLLNDFNRDLADYMQDLEFDEEDFRKAEERLNLLNHLKGKYGSTLEDVLEYGQNRMEQVEKLADYENYMLSLRAKYEQMETLLMQACAKASKVRKKHGAALKKKLLKALEELNFLSVEFDISITEKPVGAGGCDDVEFLISTNPGEALKPLGHVASGGELSRVMLAIKTVLADRDAVDTLIFDEIDAGISGRTAWKVSEKLGTLGKAHQVICITHLPQIAAMADSHFAIEKATDGSSTVTAIKKLEEEDSLKELARLLGSDTLTEAALLNAREMKEQAFKQKGK